MVQTGPSLSQFPLRVPRTNSTDDLPSVKLTCDGAGGFEETWEPSVLEGAPAYSSGRPEVPEEPPDAVAGWEAVKEAEWVGDDKSPGRDNVTVPPTLLLSSSSYTTVRT